MLYERELPKKIKLKILKTTALVCASGLLLFLNNTPSYANSFTNTINVTWGNPQPVMVLTPGDKVRIQTQLTTSDNTVPESIEGEELEVQLSTPGSYTTSSGITDKLQTTQIDSVPNDPVSGSPELSAYITGYDADESAKIVVTVNPVEAVKKTAEQINYWESMASAYEAGHLNADAAAKLCPPPYGEWCPQMEEGLAAYYSLQALYYERLAGDPPDPNYMMIALPEAPAIPNMPYYASAPNSVIDAYNAMADNFKQSIGLEQAILTTLNRATGAMVAQDVTWQTKQTQAAATYLLQLANLTSQQVTLRKQLHDAWIAAGLSSLVPTASDLHSYQIQVYYNGLPSLETQMLTEAGLTAQDIDYLRRVEAAQEYYQVAGLNGFPDALINPGTTTALQNASAGLTNVVVTNATPLAAGQKLIGAGLVLAANNEPVDFEFHAQLEDDASSNGTINGELALHDRATDFEIEDAKVTSAYTIGSMMIIDGAYSLDDGTTGTYQLIAVSNSLSDNGKDTLDVTLSNGMRFSGMLSNGAVKIVNTANGD